MVNLTPIRFDIVGENGVTFGAFAIDSQSENPINVEQIFQSLQDQQPEGIKIIFSILPEQPRVECENKGIHLLDSKIKVEEVINNSIAFLYKLDNPNT